MGVLCPFQQPFFFYLIVCFLFRHFLADTSIKMAKKSSRSSKNESSITKMLIFPSQIKDVLLFFQLLKIELNHRN